MSEPQRVLLRCPDCRLGSRNHGDIAFEEGLPRRGFLYTCPKGHRVKVRPLSRDERRKLGKDAPPFVAARWEGD